MSTIIFSHSSCLGHDPGPLHPESPDRLTAVISGLEDDDFKGLERREANPIDEKKLQLIHNSAYIESVFDNVPVHGLINLDPDSCLSAGSGEAMRRAAGAAVDAVDAVVLRKAKNAFCAIRPPGHHAEASHAMGFCFFNAAALAAMHARTSHNIKKIAVIDFDVHHGNGTQHILEIDPDMFYGSSHQFPAYPGTGSAREVGCANNVINVPLPPGSGSKAFRESYINIMLPGLKTFKPEFVIISAGFDAHIDDPLAQLELKEDDYAWVTKSIIEETIGSAECRVVSLLEGGYNLDALRKSTQSHIRALMHSQ